MAILSRRWSKTQNGDRIYPSSWLQYFTLLKRVFKKIPKLKSIQKVIFRGFALYAQIWSKLFFLQEVRKHSIFIRKWPQLNSKNIYFSLRSFHTKMLSTSDNEVQCDFVGDLGLCEILNKFVTIISIVYIFHTIVIWSIFLKPFLKGNILRSGEWGRGKFDFDHHFAFLTNFLKR